MSVAADLQHLVRVILANAGYTATISTDMYDFIAKLSVKGGYKNPHFHPQHTNPEGAQWLSVEHATDGLVMTMAWRYLEDVDFIEHAESGRVYWDNPDLHGWKPHFTGAGEALSLKGRVCSRGGLYSFDPERRLPSWFATSICLADALERDVDFTTGISFPGIGNSRVPFQIMGFFGNVRCFPHDFPNAGLNSIHILWSAKAHIAYECERRANFLRSRQDADPKDIVSSYIRKHVTDSEPIDDAVVAKKTGAAPPN